MRNLRNIEIISVWVGFILLIGIIIYLSFSLYYFWGYAHDVIDINNEVMNELLLAKFELQTLQIEAQKQFNEQIDYTQLALNLYFIEVSNQQPKPMWDEMFDNGTLNLNSCLLFQYAQTKYTHKKYIVGKLDIARDICIKHNIYLQ